MENLHSNSQDTLPRLIDRSQAEEAVSTLLAYLGRSGEEDGLRDTPRRVIDLLEEIHHVSEWTFTTFENEGHDQMIIQKDIPFYSMCEHHLIPFFGVAHVGYIPANRIVGLSKLARSVHGESRGFQNQERITTRIANLLNENLMPQGVGVVLEARHLCMEMRGAKVPGAVTSTHCFLGAIHSDHKAREEFLQAIR